MPFQTSRRRAPTRPSKARKPKEVATKTYVKRAIAATQEVKFINASIVNNPSTTGTMTKIMSANPAQVAGDSGRDGDTIMIKSLHLRCLVTVADGTNWVRLILFQWKPSDANYTPVVSDLIGLTGTPIQSQYRHDIKEQDEYNVLMDRTLNLTTYTPQYLVQKNWYKGFRKRVQFDGAGMKANNHLFLLAISDSGVAAHPLVDGVLQVRYTDS